MSKFKVGDRVRVIFSLAGNAGKQGVVFEVGPNKVQGCGYVEDCVGVDIGETIGWGPSQWFEPILYDGAQPSEFSYSELMDNLRTKVQEEV